jgi:hypothetical protein
MLAGPSLIWAFEISFYIYIILMGPFEIIFWFCVPSEIHYDVDDLEIGIGIGIGNLQEGGINSKC